MKTGEMDELFDKHHVSGVAIRNQLIANGWLLKVRAVNDGPAQVFVHPRLQGEIGLIMPYEKDFVRVVTDCAFLRPVSFIYVCLAITVLN